MLEVVLDEEGVTESGLIHCLDPIGLGNERESTPHALSVSKLNREIWLAMTDIGEEKRPLYIFIYAVGLTGRAESKKNFANQARAVDHLWHFGELILGREHLNTHLPEPLWQQKSRLRGP